MFSSKFVVTVELQTANEIELPTEAIHGLDLDSEAQDDAGPWFQCKILDVSLAE